ncbi:MAG: DivIVA domain-containing protein [Snowella sp.]
MTRRENPTPETNQSHTATRRRIVDFDVQQELAELQELIYESFHIPLTNWTVVDEGKLLDQIEMISDNLPEAIQKALAVLDQEESIMTQAEAYAQRIVQSAQQQAAEILDQSGIIQQAEQQASQIRLQVQQEVESLQRQTMSELEQIRQVTTQEVQQFRQQTTQEVQQYRQQTVRECQEIQQDADKYADAVLSRIERDLGEMMRIVANGRQRLYENPPNQNSVNQNMITPQVGQASTRVVDRPERSRKRPR